MLIFLFSKLKLNDLDSVMNFVIKSFKFKIILGRPALFIAIFEANVGQVRTI